jgi:hypothetical protein
VVVGKAKKRFAINMSTTFIPKHIYWSCRGQTEVDLSDPDQKKWFLERTLVNGTMADIRGLNLVDVEKMLPVLHLPGHVRTLWMDYFDCRDTDAISP